MTDKSLSDVYIAAIVTIVVFSSFLAVAKTMHPKLSFEVTGGFECHRVDGTISCPKTYTYRNVPTKEAIEILGQVIKHQGGEFKILD